MIKVSLAQLTIDPIHFQKNVDKVLYLIDSLPASPDHLLLLPELWSTGFTPYLEEAANFNQSLMEKFQNLASSRNLTLAGTYIYRCDDGFFENRLLVISPSQTDLAQYSKIHLIEAMNEKDWFRPGTHLSTVNLFDQIFGLAICYDLRFSELFRRLNLCGATIYLLPAQWPEKRIIHFQKLLQARAIENQAFFISANTVGRIGNTQFGGESMVVDPYGEIILSAGKSEDVILSIEINCNKIIQWRNEFPAQRDRKDLKEFPVNHYPF